MISRILRSIRQYLGSTKQALFLWLLERWEHTSGTLITIHRRPLYASGVTHAAHPLKEYPPCAIVLQGQVLHKEQFTLETVRIYKKVYPFAHIIVSTWAGEDVRAIEEAGATVIHNIQPPYRGPYNVNLQITSAAAGMRAAKTSGARFVLKTRTDQRMYNPDIFETMTNALSYFPPSERSGQHARLLFATGGNVYRPYLLPDMFVFGEIDDMLEYWDTPLVEEGASNPGGDSIFRPELYLGSTFLTKKGWPLDWTVEQMWTIQRECFISLDWSEIDIYWYKYGRFKEYGERKKYDDRSSSGDLVGFAQWFNIFSNQENKIPPPTPAARHDSTTKHKSDTV